MGIVGRIDQYASMLTNEFDEYSMSENLLTYSEQFDNAVWSKAFTSVSTNASVAPNGILSADNITNTPNFASYIAQGKTLVNSTTYTFSLYVKPLTANKILAIEWGNPGTSYSVGNFDLSTLSFSGQGSGTITEFNSGWYRISHTVTTSATGTVTFNVIYLGAYGTTSASVTFAFWGAQLERSTVATDYTQTTTTAISRVLPTTTNINITGLSTYFASGFSENVGIGSTLSANVFPPYDLVYDDFVFGGTLFGPGQGRYKRQNIDKSVVVYNEIDEVTDFRDIVRTGLVLDLDAGQALSYKTTGTAWINLVSSGIGTLTNGPTFTTENGGAIVFDGTDDFSTSGALLGSFASFTVIIWFYPTSVTNFENPIDCNYAFNGTTGNIGPRLEMATGGALAWYYSNDTANNNNFYSHAVVSSGLAANTWHCAAITYNGGTNTSITYYNGSATGLSRTLSGTPTGFVGVMNNVNVGRGFSLGGAERIFTGRVSNTQIYNRVLTAAEITQNYNAFKHRFGL